MKYVSIAVFFFLHIHLLCGQEDDRPNIILIVTDDQRWDGLGFAGNDIIQTPHLDKLASQSTYYSNSFVTSPICAASRASLLTGHYERTHKYTFETEPLHEAFVNLSFPKLLKDSGYQMGFFGKLGVRLSARAQKSMFNKIKKYAINGYFRLTGESRDEHIHLTDLTTDDAIDYISERNRDEPFCVVISYNAPHADDDTSQQYFWPERNDHLYRDITIPNPARINEIQFKKLPPVLKDSLSMNVIRWRWRFDTEEKYQEMVKGYYRLISTIDDNIGKLRDVLLQENLADNTIIIFTSDNGYFLGERNLAGKWLMYENSLRVPLFIYQPNVSASKSNSMALNIDLAPTILSFAGVQIPSKTVGRDLMNESGDLRREFMCEQLYKIKTIPRSEGFRTTKWKYLRYLDPPNSEELYYLSSDPMEATNLVDDPKFNHFIKQLRDKVDDRILNLDNLYDEITKDKL